LFARPGQAFHGQPSPPCRHRQDPARPAARLIVLFLLVVFGLCDRGKQLPALDLDVFGRLDQLRPLFFGFLAPFAQNAIC
jgi:hypothetical protein